MEWINYHHLLYFWMVAREGSVTAAAKELRLAQPTVSGQIRALEASLDEQLFVRVGRRLELTEVGRVTFRYADEIFGLGRELMDTLKGRPGERLATLHVGIADVLSKLIAHRLLEPAMHMEEPVRIVCKEGKTDQLLADLAIHGVDLVLADAPIPGGVRVKAYNHFLGESGIAFFGVKRLMKRYKKGFPQSLEQAPILLPTENTNLRRDLDHWLDQIGVRPRIIAEFEDSALLKTFGEHGEGMFPASTVIEAEIRHHYGVHTIGHVPNVRERYYAISVERRIKHPAVAAISEEARKGLFCPESERADPLPDEEES